MHEEIDSIVFAIFSFLPGTEIFYLVFMWGDILKILQDTLVSLLKQVSRSSYLYLAILKSFSPFHLLSLQPLKPILCLGFSVQRQNTAGNVPLLPNVTF